MKQTGNKALTKTEWTCQATNDLYILIDKSSKVGDRRRERLERLGTDIRNANEPTEQLIEGHELVQDWLLVFRHEFGTAQDCQNSIFIIA